MFSAESRNSGCTEGSELEPHGTVLLVFSAGSPKFGPTIVTAPIANAGQRRKDGVQRGSLRRLPLLIGRDFFTPARAVVSMGERTPNIGTGVGNLVVSRAGHLALRLNAQTWHREADVVLDIPAHLRQRRRRRDPRTESLLRSVSTVLFSSRDGSSTCARNLSFTPGEQTKSWASDLVPSLHCLFGPL